MHQSESTQSRERKLRVLLADDHPVVLAGIKSLVAAEGDIDVVGEAVDGNMCIELARELAPDIAVIDVSMPGLAGTALALRMKETCADCRLLTLTVHEDHGYLRQMLEAGVSGYLLKKSAAINLIKAIRIIEAGGLYIDPSYSTRALSSANADSRSTGSSQSMQLSKREIDVLQLLAAGHSVKATAASLQIGIKTAETYKSRAFEKLGLQSRVQLIRYALSMGWLKQ